MSTPYTPTTGHGRDGSFWKTWAEYQSGTSGPMYAFAQFQGPGDPTISGSFQLVDGSAIPLSIADGSMSNVEQAADAPFRWTFTPVIDGDSAPSVWMSFDDLATWTRII